MYYNPGYPSDIVAIYPHGTNSTMFTNCCDVAITDREVGCPKCGREVVGDTLPTPHERGQARWKNATRFWKRP